MTRRRETLADLRAENAQLRDALDHANEAVRVYRRHWEQTRILADQEAAEAARLRDEIVRADSERIAEAFAEVTG